MLWIAPSEKDTDNAALEKRLWDAADTATRVSANPECEATWRDFRRAKDHWSANSGLKSQEYSAPVLGLIFLRFAEVRLPGHEKVLCVASKVICRLALVMMLGTLRATGQVEPSPPTRTTGFVYGDIYLKHDTGVGHPERAERLTAIVNRLKKEGLLLNLVAIEPVPTSPEWLTTVHTPEYVDRVKTSCRAGVGFLDSGDTPVCVDSYDVALAAVGGVLSAIDAVMERRVTNAFCAVRPPGHHALKDQAMGFCLFNNIAIAARYIQKQHKLAKVLIVDWDVHHGNGTQAAFYGDPTVFYFSTHQSPFYPGTGNAEDRGEAKGVGFTLNVPLPAGSGDAEYQKAFEERLKPAAKAFKPDFVLISAGFDAAQDDLLGRMKLTPAGYTALTRIVKGIAEESCHGRLISILEGGYNLGALAASVEAHVRTLKESPSH